MDQDFKEKLSKFNSAREMKEFLKKYILAGMNIAEVKTMLEKVGFKCDFHYQQDFLESEYLEAGKLFEKIDYLYCDLEKGSFKNIFIGKRWQLGIVIENEKVKDVLVSYGLIGL